MKRNIRYKPSKASATMSFIMGIVFIIIGLSMVIPGTLSTGFLPVAIFGLAWTGFAVAITVINAKYLFGKGDSADLFGGYEVEDDGEDWGEGKRRPSNAGEGHVPTIGPDVKARLEQLETLNKAGLLTPEEYTAKRQEILKSL